MASLIAWFLPHTSAQIDGETVRTTPWLLVALALVAAASLSWVGYQFSPDTEAASDSVAGRAGNQNVGLPKLAVIPLQDTTPDGSLGWLASGLSEEIRRQIGLWQSFSVVPAVFTPADVVGASELDVDLIMSGRIQNTETGVQVNIELTDVSSAETRWRSEFVGESENPQLLQAKIAANIARYFEQSTAALQGPSNPTAYKIYLQSLHFVNYADIDEVAYWREKVLTADPSWREGWNQLAFNELQRFIYLQDPAYLIRSRSHLDRSRGEGYSYYFIETLLQLWGHGDLDGGERRVQGMVSFGGEDADTLALYGWLLNVSGLYAAAEPGLRHAVELNPASIGAWEQLAWARANLGDLAGALDAARAVAALTPLTSGGADDFLSLTVLGMSEDHERVRARLRRFDAHVAEVKRGSTWRAAGDAISDLAHFHLAVQSDDWDAAAAVAARHAARGRHAAAGLMYLRSGDESAASKEFELARPTAYYRLWDWMYWTTVLTPELRRHPQVRAHEAAMGLTDEWRTTLCTRASQLPEFARIKCNPASLRP